MNVFQFISGHPPKLAGTESLEQDTAGFYWIDVERSEAEWHKHLQPWLNIQLHEKHIRDTLNENHPPYYDSTDDYDILIMRALCNDCPVESPKTHAIAFIITENTIISVRPSGDRTFLRLHQRFLASQRGAPTTSPMLFYLLLDQIVDVLLARRDVTSELLSNWQDTLLDGNNPFNDWRRLMQLRSALRRMEVIIESQIDALSEWREQTLVNLDAMLNVRFNDLKEHLRRVYNHSVVVQHDVDALVQIYFSANTQRTNEILQFLAVVSAIFLPLNLLAGVFGMNFVNFPLLKSEHGIWALFAIMLVVVIGLLLWFRKRSWV